MHSGNTADVSPVRGALPWLSPWSIAVAVLALVMPFLFVSVPPLVDMPGHMGAAAIAAAGPDSPLAKYFGWSWTINFNLGGQIVMEAARHAIGLVRAGWLSAVIATALLATGCLALIRVLNPRGGFGIGWALIFVFSYPLLTGFLNYVLALGLALIVAAGAIALESRPRLRIALLVVAQPLLLLCHAIGGLMMPLLVGCYALGKRIEEGRQTPREFVRRMISDCWPLLVSVICLAVYVLLAPSGGPSKWQWFQKVNGFKWALRDQNWYLDAFTMLAAAVVLLWGPLMGAKWPWRRAVPVLGLIAFYIVVPTRLSGSYEVDTRLIPLVMMVALGLQDWSGVDRRRAMAVALAGIALFATRLTVTGLSFKAYDEDYRAQLMAMEHIEPGSRVVALVQHHCGWKDWRRDRRDHLASLTSLYRQSWSNDNWQIPGLDMLNVRYRPAQRFAIDPSHYVWAEGCPGRRLARLDKLMPRVPYEKVDYLWLIGTGAPTEGDPRLALVWQAGNSLLYAVRPPASVRYSSEAVVLNKPRNQRG